MRTAFALAASLTLFATIASAQEEPIDKLVKKLASGNYAEREKAEQQLKAQGTKILPALQKELSHGNLELEARRRLQELVASLETVKALEPKRVTLTGKRTLARIVAEVKKQTGMEIRAEDQDKDRTYPIEVKDLPFWEALGKIGVATGRIVNVPETSGAIELKASDHRPPLVLTDGVLRLELKALHEQRNVDFTKPGNGKSLGQHDHLLTLKAALLVEPRYHLLVIDSVVVKTAVDENGTALGFPGWGGSPRPFTRDFEHPIEIHLQRGSEKARVVKEIRGTIACRIVVPKNVLITEKFLESKGTKIKAGSAELAILQASAFQEGVGHLFVDLLSGPVPLHSAEATRRFERERFSLEDAKGNRYSSLSSMAFDGGVVSFSVRFAQPEDAKIGPPARLIFEDWVVLHHTVPFVFKDVPLP
jgi:hypothetical protein